jgi:Fic family protein
MDLNGKRKGILPLFLWFKQRISSPMFYISEYFDENRDQYVENLRRISDAKDWEHWIFFFLDAITTQSKRNSEKANQVLSLYNRMREKIIRLTKSPNAGKVLDTLFITPILQTPNFIKLSGLESKTAHRIIAKLKSDKILTTMVKPSGRTPEVLVFDDLFELVR